MSRFWEAWVSSGEGVRALQWPRVAVAQRIRSASTLWLWSGLSLLGYIALFVALHLRSLGWAPGQVLDPFHEYWQFFYSTIFSETRVMASRRSSMGMPHPLVMLAALGLIAAGYLGMLRHVRSLPSDRELRLPTLAGLALVFSIPLLLLPNLLSADIYSYISFGRIATLHAGNPFIDPPIAFPRDPLLQWVNWLRVPSVYGPTWIYLSILLTVVVESLWSHVITYVLAYKLLALGLHLVNGILIWAILWHWQPEQRSRGVTLYLLNPLALIEFSGNGHNDVLMITLILAGVLLHLRGRWLWTVAAFALAVLAKWIALPLLPLYGLLLLGSTRSLRRRIWYTISSLAVSAALVVGLYLPYFEGPETFKVLAEAPPQKRFINSLGEMVVRETLYGMHSLGYWPHPAEREFSPLIMRAPQLLREDTIHRPWREEQRIRLQRHNQLHRGRQREVLLHQRSLQNSVRTAGWGILLATCLAGAALTRSLRTMLLAAAWIFFVYTTITAVWVWPWYVTWFVALAALADWRVTGRAAILLSLLALLIYPLFPHLPEPGLLDRFRALIVFGPPLAFATYHLARLIRSYRRREWSLHELVGNA